MRQFPYDIAKLIKAVRDRPCLWNKNLEEYKDRVERRIAWEEIFNLMDDRYETMSREDKRLLGEIVQCKWTNIRDTFSKSLKTRMGKARKRYVLHNHLTFLLENQPLTSDEQILGYDDQPNIPFEAAFEEASESEERPKLPRKRLKKEKSEDANIDFVSVDPVHDPRIMNEDEAFFASLLPTVVNYNEDERLEFRMEVLSLMRQIRDKRCALP